MSQHDAKPVSPAPVQYPRKAEIRSAVIDCRNHLERRIPIGCAADAAHRRKVHSALQPLLQQAGLVDGLVHLFDGQPAVLQRLLQTQPAHRHIGGRVDGNAQLRHIKQRDKSEPLRVKFRTFQLERKVRVPFFQAAPDLAAAGALHHNRRVLQTQLVRQRKQVVPEHPHGLMAPCNDQMPFRRIFLLLYRTGMAHCLLIQGRQLLCLGVKVPACRGQDHPARYMLKQFKLQLPFQRADLLRKRRLRKIQCLCCCRKTVHLYDLHKSFQCTLVHLRILAFLY